MNKFLPLILFVLLATPLLSQEDDNVNMQNIYLQEIIDSFTDNSFTSFDSDDLNWREKTVIKVTSNSNKQETSFLKTAMVLHMLRYKIGDEDFYRAIEKYKNHLSETKTKLDLLDFQHYLENESNEELTSFFNDWFKSKGHPSYEIGWFQNDQTKEMSFTVSQKQSDESVEFFEMPVPIQLIGTKGEKQMVRLELSQNGQSFNGRVPFLIQDMIIDPDYQLISRNNNVKQGLDQELLNKDISLYPNPAINLIKIHNLSHAKVERISVYNMLGKMVLEQMGPISKLDLKSLSKGTHLVKIETNQGTIHKTILKK